MRPDDTAAREAEAWRGFVQQLADHLAGRWPAMLERLAARYPAFVDLAVHQALDAGLSRAPSVARYVNLCFVWGPSFHDKPGFDWAAKLLADARRQEWLALHQLVQRSLLELRRLPGARIEPAALAAADASVLDAFAALGHHGHLHPADPPPAPRAACDLEAIDIRLQDEHRPLHYQWAADTDWQRQPLPLPGPVRVDASQPMPALLAGLSPLAGQGAAARLQVRVRSLTVCDADRHAGLAFCGPHGLWHWAGHQTQAASWPLAPREPAPLLRGPGTAIAEETSPELHRLLVETCGLRDDGDPLGPQQATLAVWPATQWWLELQRAQPEVQALLPPGRPAPRPATRCRVERDGQAQDATPLRRQFEDGLDGATAAGLQGLADAWRALPGLNAPRLEARLGLLLGQASLSWGWHFGPAGLAGPALMRVLGPLALQACLAELELGGELAGAAGEAANEAAGDAAGDAAARPAAGSADPPAWLADTRTRLTLRFCGQAELRQVLRREQAQPELAEVLGAAVTRWRFPAELLLEPLATDAGRILQPAGPVIGALVGEAGLRPRTTGGSGWEWFAGLRIEAVSVPLLLDDPLLGRLQRTLSLLPAMTLLTWSLG